MRLRNLTKWVAGGGLLALALSVHPDPSHGQFPPPGGGFPSRGDGGRDGGRGGFGDRGGFGGGDRGGFGGGGFTADSGFDRMVQATGATGGDVVDYSRLSPEYRERTNRFLQMSGQPPLPTSGTVTRDQYRQQFAQRSEAMRSRFGGGPPGTVTMSATPGGPTPGQPSFAPQGPGGPSAFGGGQFQMTDEQVQGMMRRYDRDGDGRISAMEAQSSDRLRGSFQQHDRNGDGFIDLTEYKGYVTERMSGGNDRGRSQFPGGPPGGGFPPPSPPPPGSSDPNAQPPQWGQPPGGYGGPGGWDRDRGRDPQNLEPERPVVFRYGKLPKDLPSWFTSLDDDKDGQVGLYEWRKGGRTTADYLAMDQNGDGLLTAEEYIRHKKEKDGAVEASAGSAAARFGGGDGDRPAGRDRGGRPGDSSASKKMEKEEDRRDKDDKRGNGNGNGGGGNPFRR